MTGDADRPGGQAAARIHLANAITLVDAAIQAMMIPVLPFVVLEMGGGPLAVVLLVVVHDLAAAVANPLLGALGDRIGRARLVLLSLAGSLAGLIALLAFWSLPALIVYRAVTGALTARNTLLRAMVLEPAPPDTHGRILGSLTAAGALGAALGPVIILVLASGPGGQAADRGLLWPSMVLGACACVAGWLIARIKEPTRPAAAGSPVPVVQGLWPLQRVDARRYHAVLLLQGGLSFAWGALFATTALHVEVSFGWGVQQTSILMILASVLIIAARLIGGRTAFRGKPPMPVACGLAAVSGLCLAGIGISAGPVLFVLGFSLFTAFINVAMIGPSVAISQTSPGNKLAMALGLRQSVAVLAGLASALIGGLAFERGMGALSYLVCGVALVVTALVAAWLDRVRSGPGTRGGSRPG